MLASSCISSNTNAVYVDAAEEISNLQRAKQLGQSRQHLKSIKLLQRYLIHHPAHAEALFMIGSAYFAVAEYEKAAGFFRRVLSAAPDHIDARHRLWAARLQNRYADNVVKNEIRFEINQLLMSAPANPGILMACYYGYRYLWDQNKQQKIIHSLANLATSKLLRQRIAYALTYEIITAKSKNSRTRLSVLYLNRYRSLSDDNIATSWLFSGRVIKKDLRLLDSYMQKFTGTTLAHGAANFSAARALIRNSFKLPNAISHLHTNISNIENNSSDRKYNNFLVNNTRQLGIAYFKNHGYKLAHKYLLQAQKMQPENGTTAYYLGKIAEIWGNPQQAIQYYRSSLVASGRQAGAQRGLARLLNLNKISVPSFQYFAKKEGVVVFTDVTHRVGLDNVKSHRVAWGDFDNDGDDDLLVNGNRLFKNNNGVFSDITQQMHIPTMPEATGGIWGDFNNDGNLDIFVAANGTNRLLQNIDRLKFSDVSSNYLPEGNSSWSEAAAWGDFNGDGYLDLYIANYQQPAVERGICSHDKLLQNIRGNHFFDASSKLVQPDEAMCGRGVTWADINGDKKQDIFVANYRLDPNFLWLNAGNKFKESAGERNVAGFNNDGYYGNSIGPVFSDFDNNGKLDLFVANLSHPRDRDFSDLSQLFQQTADRMWVLHNRSGIGFEETLSDPAAADVDNDGDMDLFISAIYSTGQSHLYLNDGLGNFRDVSWISGTRLSNSWGAAFSDFDNDGDVDLIVASQNGLRLLRNDGPNGHWIKITLRSRRCNTFGIGARIEMRYQSRAQYRVITAGRGTGNQDSLTQLFGLGSYRGPVEITITDVCGYTIKRTLREVNHHYRIGY